MTPEMHSQIVAAAAQLRAGGVVAFPTETVYGLGADISNPSAVRRIFEIKKRPIDHPLIVHFADAARLQYWAEEVPEAAWRLAECFWPGPLTLILPRSCHVPSSVTGGQDMVGLRIPDHPIALALLNELGSEKALAAPSANRFGRISPTTAAHVREELGHAVDMILDGGACAVGLESTIVGFSGQTATILRPGGVSLAALAEVLNGKIVLPQVKNSTVRVPGALVSHYAPLTPLEVWPTKILWQRAHKLEAQGRRVMIIGWSEPEPDPVSPENKNIAYFLMPCKAAAYGSRLYAILRRFDHGRFDYLLAEAPPDDPAWLAVADRLQRASHTSFDKLQDDDYGKGNTPDENRHE